MLLSSYLVVCLPMQSTQNTEDDSPAVPPPPLIYSQVVKPKGMFVWLYCYMATAVRIV